jgi:hypothetical protein
MKEKGYRYLVFPVKISFYIEKGGPCTTPTPLESFVTGKDGVPHASPLISVPKEKKMCPNFPFILCNLYKIKVHPFFTFVIKSNSEKNGPLTHQKYLS